MKKLRKISNILIMAMAIAAVFTSCKKVLPTASFTYAPETVVQYDVVDFTSTSTDATSYSWDIGNGAFTSTDANPSVQFMTAGDVVVKLTVTNEDGEHSTEQTITVNAPDNHYMLDDAKIAITSEFFWYSAMGSTYIRLLSDIAGQENQDLIKLYPNMGLGELPGTYTFDAENPEGTYKFGYTSDYAGMNFAWTGNSTLGEDLVIEEVDTDIYRITWSGTMDYGNYDWDAGVFVVEGTKTLSASYIGGITPLAK